MANAKRQPRSCWYLAHEQLESRLCLTELSFVSHDLFVGEASKYFTSVFAADFDGDDDLDVLSTSPWSNGGIAWHENTDGKGSFGPQQVIGPEAARAVFAVDIEGDGDVDIVSTSGGRISWYKNTDGKGSFGPQQVITSKANGAWSVFATDLDRDGDADVLSVSATENKIVWYENMDGQGAFGPEQIISSDASGARSVFAADVNGDGHVDVVSASETDNKIAWYQNTDGKARFGAQRVISAEAKGAYSVHVVDVDGDGDLDVLSAVAWYENIDGQGTLNRSRPLEGCSRRTSTVTATWMWSRHPPRRAQSPGTRTRTGRELLAHYR